MEAPAFIFDILNKELYSIHEAMLQKIAVKYKIDIDELTKEFLTPLNIIDENLEKVVIYKKQQKKTIPNNENRCCARVWNRGKGGQCTRACKSNSLFCSQHVEVRRHGVITEIPSKDIFCKKKNSIYI